VHTKRSPDGIDFWVVLGHTEHQRVSRDWQQFSSLEGASITPTPEELEGHSVITSDPPAHTRLRKLISAGFTPRMVRQLDDLVERRASQVLDAAAEHGTCNFVDDVALVATRRSGEQPPDFGLDNLAQRVSDAG
jgi:cytochrome P450